MTFGPDEAEAGRWRAESLTVAAATVVQPCQGGAGRHRPVVLALDGLSSSGRTPRLGREPWPTALNEGTSLG
jgi:hypothetical protein